MTDPLTAHRNIDAHTQRDLTRQEAEAILAHRLLMRWCRQNADIVAGYESAADCLSTTRLVAPDDVAHALREYAGYIEHDIARIESGEYRVEGV